jgi:hypothetical protein
MTGPTFSAPRPFTLAPPPVGWTTREQYGAGELAVAYSLYQHAVDLWANDAPGHLAEDVLRYGTRLIAAQEACGVILVAAHTIRARMTAAADDIEKEDQE